MEDKNMKKFLSVLLVLCMVASLCVMLTSCPDRLTEKEAKKNTDEVVTDAITKASKNFFTDDLNLEKLTAKASNGGMFTISVESKTLLGELGIDKISETVYMDSNKGRTVADTLIKMNGEDLTARIFLEKNAFMLNSEALLGSGKTLAVNFDTFEKNFKDSALAEMFGLNFDEGATDEGATNESGTGMSVMFQTIFSSFKSISDPGATEKFIKDLNSKLNETVTSEGKKDDQQIIVSYTVNNEVIQYIIDEYVGEMSNFLTDATAPGSDMNLDISELVDINLTVKLFINSKSQNLTKMTLNGTIIDKEGSETVNVTSTTLFSKNEISFDFKMDNSEDEEITAKFKLTKEEKDGKIVYALTLSGGMDEVSVNLLNASLTYTKKTGEFEIAGDIYNDGDDRLKASVKGVATSTKKDAKIEISSVSVADVTVDLKIVLEIKTEAQIPAAPTNAKDITAMSAEDWMELMQEVSQSKLGSLIGGMNKEEPMPDGEDYWE